MNSSDLLFFAAVAEAGAISRAAVALNTVQSNVTARIRTLEQSLQTTLFYRGKKGVTLTHAGERLLPYALQMARLLSDAERSVVSDEVPRGALRLGSMETTAALRLPKLLAAYACRYPEVDIELELGPTETLIASVLDRRIEAAFVAGPVNHAELTAIALLREKLVLVAGVAMQSHDDVVAMLASKREARVLVFKAGCSHRLRLEGFLAAHGLSHVRRMDFGTLDGIIGCVEAGMGVSMLPQSVVEPMRQAGRVSYHHLPGSEGVSQTLLIYRMDHLPTAAFKRFLDQAREAFDPSHLSL